MSKIQENILSQIKKEGITIDVYLVSGIKLSGKLLDYDDEVLSLDGSAATAKPQLIYKHAISTIVPSKNLL